MCSSNWIIVVISFVVFPIFSPRLIQEGVRGWFLSTMNITQCDQPPLCPLLIKEGRLLYFRFFSSFLLNEEFVEGKSLRCSERTPAEGGVIFSLLPFLFTVYCFRLRQPALKLRLNFSLHPDHSGRIKLAGLFFSSRFTRLRPDIHRGYAR